MWPDCPHVTTTWSAGPKVCQYTVCQHFWTTAKGNQHSEVGIASVRRKYAQFSCKRSHTFVCFPQWASAHRSKWGQPTPPGKIDEKLKSENMQKKSSFLRLCYILRAIRAGRCRERCYADHIFIQIYFRMHHFIVKFSKCSSPQPAGGIDPPTKILRTFLLPPVPCLLYPRCSAGSLAPDSHYTVKLLCMAWSYPNLFYALIDPSSHWW